MLLTLDLGNTSVSACIFKGKKAVSRTRFLYDGFPKSVHKWLKSGRFNPDRAVFCSVNPKYDGKLRHYFKAQYPGKKIVQLRNSDIPLKNKYIHKNQVGIDRLINVYGVGTFYKFPCLVIDIGTAVTFDIGGPRGTFEGGLIFAGPNIAFNALQERTAKIGKFPLKFNGRSDLFGKSTKQCATWGLVLGYGHLIRGIIQEFRQWARKKWKTSPAVIVTGGYLNVIKPYLTKDDQIDELLTLKAMAHLSQSSRGKACLAPTV